MKVKKYFNHIKLFLQNSKQYKGGTNRIRYNRKLFLNFLLKALFSEKFTITFSDLHNGLYLPIDQYLFDHVLTDNKFYIAEKKYRNKRIIYKISSAI